MVIAADELRAFSADLLAAAGLARRHCPVVAQTFVEADLLGYTTHGVGMLPMFTGLLEQGAMSRDGEPVLLSRHAARAVLDGILLPGPVVMQAAVELGLDLAEAEPVVTVSVQRSANTACLATYLPRIAATGRIALLMVANPDNAAVAPPGAAQGVYGTDPLAACFPTAGDPVLFDFATSATSNRMVERAVRAGTPLTCEALVDPDGAPSADPGTLGAGGAIAPMGGAHWGHKGFAIALLIEVLTGCLTGFGRARASAGDTTAGSACLLQIIDPGGFAGRPAFIEEMKALTAAVHAARPARGGSGARLPGEQAFRRRRRQLRDGVELHPDIPPLLHALALRYDLELPAALVPGG